MPETLGELDLRQAATPEAYSALLVLLDLSEEIYRSYVEHGSLTIELRINGEEFSFTKLMAQLNDDSTR